MSGKTKCPDVVVVRITKCPRPLTRGGFAPTWEFPSLSPIHPPTRAGTSTIPLSTFPHSPTNFSQQLLLLQAGDVETNSGPAPRCGVFRKSTTAKAVICCACWKSIHQSCSDMTRTMQKQWRQANDYQCTNCEIIILDGCREWRCCGIAQSPLTSTMPSRNHPTSSQISESTMTQEVTITHSK